MTRIYRKLKYTLTVFRWFVWYNLVNGESRKVWHLALVLIKHVVRKTPYAAIIETSNTCNFHCPTCPTPHKLIYNRRPAMIMELETYKRVIDHVKDYVHIVYVYNSNEPLLHPQIAEMIRYAADNDLHTMISTNCSLLDEKMTEKLLDSGLGEIRFALDSLNKRSFEIFRAGGHFETVLKNIEYFCRRRRELGRKRPIVTLQFILNKYNQDEIPAIKEFARKHGIDKLYIKPFIMSEYAYPPEEIRKLAEEFYPDKDIFDEAVVYKRDEAGLKPLNAAKHCPDVNRVFTVLADGRAVMCCFDLFGDYVYGDLGSKPLKEIWFSEAAVKLRGKAYSRSFPLCGKCGNIE